MTVSTRLVPEEGVEPTHPCGQRILSPPRLPFRHSGTSEQKYHVSRHSAKPVPTNVIPEFTPRIKLSGVLDASSPERYSVGSPSHRIRTSVERERSDTDRVLAKCHTRSHFPLVLPPSTAAWRFG